MAATWNVLPTYVPLTILLAADLNNSIGLGGDLDNLHTNLAADVKDYGALGDGVTNDSVAVQAAFDAAANGTVYFPKGSYKFNVNVNYRPRIIGAGMQGTVVRSFSAGANAPFTLLDASPGWLNGEIRDMTIAGVSATQGYGVQFGHTVYVANDEIIGRWRFVNIDFNTVQWGVAKLYGNIGNTFTRCVFQNCTHGVHATEYAPGMHAGYDVYENCWFATASLSAVYYKSSRNDTGLLVFRGCGFEGNTGMALFFNGFNSQTNPGIIFEDCWFESNGVSLPVTIDGGAQSTTANFTGCPSVTFRRCSSSMSVWVQNSNLTFEDTPTDVTTLTVDADSSVMATEAHQYSTPGTIQPFLARSLKSAGTAGTTSPSLGPIFRLPHRTKLSTAHLGKVLASATGCLPATWTGTANVTTQTVADGVLFDACQQLALGVSAAEQHPTNFNVTTGKYWAWTAELKLQSGTTAGMAWAGGANPTAPWLPLSSEWTTFGSVLKSSGTFAGLHLYVQGAADGTTVLRLGAWQFLQFDTEKEALEFINSGEFAYSPPDRPRILHGTTAPTTGTWAVGDRVRNTSRTSLAVPSEWVCSIAGTPGTWQPVSAIGGRVRVRRAAVQAIANITTTAISWDTDDSDVLNWHDPAVNPTRVTPTVPGTLLVQATILWDAGPVAPLTNQTMTITKNGVAVAQVDGSNIVMGTVDVNGSTDYIEVTIYQASGAAKNLYGGAATQKSWAMFTVIG